MTPERKKKLRVITNHSPHELLPKEKKAFEDFTIFCFQLLLRKKAAEELKKEQERKAAERRKVSFIQIFVPYLYLYLYLRRNVSFIQIFVTYLYLYV